MASTVGAAAGQALGCWFVTYLIFAHCYVWWNWNATSGLMMKDENDDDNTLIPINPPKEEEQDPLIKYNLTREELDNLLELTPLEPIELIPLLEEPQPPQPNDETHMETDAMEQQLQQLERQVEQAELELQEAHREAQAMQQQIDVLQGAVQELTDAHDELLATNQASRIWHEQLQPQRDNLPRLSDGTRHSPILGKALSRVSDLTELQPADELHDHFDSIFQGLDSLLLLRLDDSNDDDDNDNYDAVMNDVSWSQFTRMLRKEYPAKENKKGQNPESICRALGGDDDDDDEDDDDDLSPPENAVTQKELDDRMQALESMLEKSYDEHDVPLIFETSRRKMEAHVASLVEQWAANVQQYAQDTIVAELSPILDPGSQKQKRASTAAYEQGYDDEGNDDDDDEEEEEDEGHCIRLEQVESLLEAGLRAVERKQDLRRSLLTAMAMEGIDTSRVILDAVLEDNDDDDGQGSPTREMDITWRQVLDRPLTKVVAQSWLPFVVDVIGGYNDSLDSWLDQTVPVDALISGQTLRQLLEFAGQYPLPKSMMDWFVTPRR